MSTRGLPLALAAALVAPFAAAQDAPQDVPAPESGAPKSERPGLFRIGPIYVTPKLRIGPIGLDTNTLWIPSRQPVDFRAAGGPGLTIVAPMGPARLVLDGGATYTYYLKNETQRRFGGDGRARLDVNRGRVNAAAEESFTRQYVRPTFEVDRRVVQDQWQTSGELGIDATSRLGFVASGTRRRYEVPGGQDFLGTDLSRTMSHTETRAVLATKYHLTSKTSMVAGGDQQWDRFPLEAARNADSNRIFGGFEVVSPTRLEGRAVGGVRLIRFDAERSRPGARRTAPYADVQLRYRFGPRTMIEAHYLQDIAYSFFDVVDAAPTTHSATYGLRIQNRLWAGFDLITFGTLVRFGTDGAITIRRDTGQRVTLVRDDTVREGGADLGHWFRRLRIGVAAVYTNRTSTFSDFGIHGLLVGGTVTYQPGLSWSR